MNFEAFAKTILYGSRMEDKLCEPSAAPPVDLSPFGSGSLPPLPVRELRLAFSKARTSFPKDSELEKERGRGLAFHFFASHELLALELMALMLLRFPEAPSAFRLGLVHTMVDEQRHLQLYVGRMQDLGVELGEGPFNRFFWDSLHRCDSLEAFLAGMCLTFEQANLDFAYHFAGRFAELGDEKSTSVMTRVMQEEVAHVGFGRAWFERYRKKADSLFAEYQAALPWPLTPARAKAFIMNRQLREEALLPKAFIDELAVYQHSKGRPPRLLTFNPEFEESLLGRSATKPHQVLRRELAPLMGLLARRDDVCVVETLPSMGMRELWQRHNLYDCEWQTPVDLRRGARLFETHLAWGQDEAELARVKGFRAKFQQKPGLAVAHHLVRKSYWTKKFGGGEVLFGLEELREKVRHSKTPLLCKSPLAVGGRGLLKVASGELSAFDERWLRAVLAKQGEIVVEAWHERVFDFSVCGMVEPGDAVRLVGVNRQWCDEKGRFRGHVLFPFELDLDEPAKRFWHESQTKSKVAEIFAAVGQELVSQGYSGAFGLDGYVYLDNGQLCLRLPVEVNVRRTMGHLALALGKKVTSGAPAAWLHLTSVDLKEFGSGQNVWTTFTDFDAALRECFPLQGPAPISSGYLPTSDPSQTSMVMTALLVGDAAVRYALKLKTVEQ